MSSKAADLLRRHRVMKSVGPSMGSPMFTGRDLFIVSINVKIRLEGKKGEVGVGQVNGKLQWRIIAFHFLVPWHCHGTAWPLITKSPITSPSQPISGQPCWEDLSICMMKCNQVSTPTFKRTHLAKCSFRPQEPRVRKVKAVTRKEAVGGSTKPYQHFSEYRGKKDQVCITPFPQGMLGVGVPQLDSGPSRPGWHLSWMCF